VFRRRGSWREVHTDGASTSCTSSVSQSGQPGGHRTSRCPQRPNFFAGLVFSYPPCGQPAVRRCGYPAAPRRRRHARFHELSPSRRRCWPPAGLVVVSGRPFPPPTRWPTAVPSRCSLIVRLTMTPKRRPSPSPTFPLHVDETPRRWAPPPVNEGRHDAAGRAASDRPTRRPRTTASAVDNCTGSGRVADLC